MTSPLKMLLGPCLAFALGAHAAGLDELSARVAAVQEGAAHADQRVVRLLNELMWFQRLGDVATVDKVRFTGPPPRTTNDPSPPPGSNEVVVSAMTFLPRDLSRSRKIPLVILAHGELHGNVASDEDARVIRELVRQGYAVIAPDYRGSSGYGGDYYKLIDYGGREIEDVHGARQWMLDHHRQIDPSRVGIIGWSHGGLIALLTVFAHPDAYQACYAGVPVSDLEERIKLKGRSYEELFSASYHLGKTFAEAPEEYRRRSPAADAHKLRTPLLIHANTNDEDVSAHEIKKLTDALQAAGKAFEHRVYSNAPGGHLFNRIDTRIAEDSRAEVWRFLARHLKPPRP